MNIRRCAQAVTCLGLLGLAPIPTAWAMGPRGDSAVYFQHGGYEPLAVVLAKPDVAKTEVDIAWMGKWHSMNQQMDERMENCDCEALAGAGPIGLIGLALIPIELAMGAFEGADEGVPKKEVLPDLEELFAQPALVEAGRQLRDAVEFASMDAGVETLEPAESNTVSAPRLEVAIDRVSVQGTALPELAFHLTIEATFRIARAGGTVREISLVRSTGHDGSSAPKFTEWRADEYRKLQDFIERSIDEMTAAAVDELFLIWHPGDRGQRWPTPTFALQPEPAAAWSMQEMLAAKSLTPTLRWESFPRTGDFDRTAAAGVSGVSYRVRIFDGDSPNGMVYERAGMIDSLLAIDEPLEACHQYLWTVRAEFVLEGDRRITEWSGYYDTERYKFRPWRARRGLPALETRSADEFFAQASQAEETSTYYRFKTPCDAVPIETATAD